MAKRPKLKKFTTPVGVFKFPALQKPDYGSEDYPDPDGSYKVVLVLDRSSPEAKALIKQLKPEYDAAIEAAQEEFDGLKNKSKDALKKKGIEGPVANALFHDVYDRETDEPTGEVEFRFKRKASGKGKKGPWTAPRPGLFDAKLNRIPPSIPVWGGSTGKINFEVSPYFIPGTAAAGISLKLVGAQVIELVTKGSGASAESMGFGEEDGDSVDDIDLDDEYEEDDDRPNYDDEDVDDEDDDDEDDADF